MVQSPFCPQCGERPVRPPDLTVRALLAKLLHAITSIDARLMRTLRCLLRRPGTLTVAYVGGQRKPFIAPFPLFLVANLFFFAAQSLTGTNVFSSSLDSHLNHQDWSPYARSLVDERLATTHTPLALYAPVFDRTVVVLAKTLSVLMIVPFAPLLALVFRRERKPFITHVVFALHLYTFLLLLFCMGAAVAWIDIQLGGEGLLSARLDNVLSLVNLAVCGTYLYLSAGVVFAARGLARLWRVVVLTFAAAAIALGYRFVLFLLTLYTT